MVFKVFTRDAVSTKFRGFVDFRARAELLAGNESPLVHYETQWTYERQRSLSVIFNMQERFITPVYTHTHFLISLPSPSLTRTRAIKSAILFCLLEEHYYCRRRVMVIA